MKISYKHLSRTLSGSVPINEISKKLFQLGHEHEIDGKILSGITRKTISQFAKNNNFKMLEKKFTKDEMLNSREVFLTSASSFVTPIIEIDNIKIGSGIIGKTSIELRNLYFKNFN